MPVDPLQDSVAVPEPPMTVSGVTVQVRPLLGETVVVRLTEPVNPLTGATVMVEVPDTPEFTLTVVGVAVIVKSWTSNVTVAEEDWEPLEPVTVTV